MDLSLIEYLESRNFDSEEIILFQKIYGSEKIDDNLIIKKMEAIYRVFSFANLPTLKINELIINNRGILGKTDHELINIAYIWNQTGLLCDAVDAKKALGIRNYSRIFLRYNYLISGIKALLHNVSCYSLLISDDDFISNYKGLYNGKSFIPSFENLIDLYGKGNTYEEKVEYINSLISSLSLRWYLDCLKKEKLNKDERKPI